MVTEKGNKEIFFAKKNIIPSAHLSFLLTNWYLFSKAYYIQGGYYPPPRKMVTEGGFLVAIFLGGDLVATL